jgi:hypothetical protein
MMDLPHEKILAFKQFTADDFVIMQTSCFSIGVNVGKNGIAVPIKNIK